MAMPPIIVADIFPEATRHLIDRKVAGGFDETHRPALVEEKDHGLR
jgi:hypothetical protein